MLDPMVKGHSLGLSQGIGTCVPLPQGWIMATPELERWTGLGP